MQSIFNHDAAKISKDLFIQMQFTIIDIYISYSKSKKSNVYLESCHTHPDHVPAHLAVQEVCAIPAGMCR
jgi:hypothetical protein